MNVVLVGFMGAGKTTVGHILAERLGQPFVDSDVLMEQRLGRSIKDVFATEGEAWFRDLEHRTVAELVRGPDAVIALGGGALGDSRTQAALRKARVVYLQVSYDEAMARVQGDEFRPMLRRADLEDIYRARLPVYTDAAALVVDTDGRRPDAVALDVLSDLTRLPATPAGSSSVFVSPVGGTYYAHIGVDLLQHVAALLPQLPEAEKAVVIGAIGDGAVGDAVAAQLADRGLTTVRIDVVDEQSAKTLSGVAEVTEFLAENAVHKDDLVLAVGGEAVCELAGFVAATFNRGMKLALIPTTLGAQADAAVGGKNGINLSRGRNLIGTIHQPISVVSDLRLACRAADRGFREGLAEIAKHALISPSNLLQFLLSEADRIRERDLDAVQVATTRSIEIKADIVSRDERERGDRVYLNYGHTFAHAMELVGGDGAAEQGDSVSLGMMAAAWLAHRQGRIGRDVVERQRLLLSGLGLATQATFSPAELREAWLRDKKYRHGVRFVVLNGLGRPEGGVHADEETLEGALQDLAG
jgi:3-dehydroquinate synthase/shikimate kinase/3-dehydroquinate synthase